MATYKIDMAAALEHLAKSRGITTSYEDLSPASRAAHTMVANKARSRKRVASDDAEGLPDKHQDFTKGFLVNDLHVFQDLYMCIYMYNVIVFVISDRAKKKKLHVSTSEDDDSQPLKAVNTTPTRPRKKRPDSIDKILWKRRATVFRTYTWLWQGHF